MQTTELPQYIQASRKGTKKRQARAKLRRRVFDGELPLETVLLADPEILRTKPQSRTITVSEVLSWPRGVQRRSRENLCKRLGINPEVELHALSPARRRRLVAALARSVK